MLKSSAIRKVQNDLRSCWNHQLCFAKGKSLGQWHEIKQSFTKEQTHSQKYDHYAILWYAVILTP